MVATASSEPAVLLSDVSFHWPGQEILLKINKLQLDPGQSMFVAGASGGGKSTLLSLIGGLISPTSGTIRVAGTSLSDLSGAGRDRFRGDQIGLIFQQFNLLPYLSAIDNVTIPVRLSSYRRGRALQAYGSIASAAESLLFGLDLERALWNRPAYKLSVGQQQRVAAARALMGRPPLIMADEPTSSLDADRQRAFVDLLLKESQKAGASVLFVSHDLSLADHFGIFQNMEDFKPSKASHDPA
ncbi:MAG: ABC transporter ATP-binding protein [Deltaproteobacteria bacterium]|jgi:putative ABC transport system ATP-binding protein|nr:ABC transporter ATP-binding protein [Deltaproteobacteria bacterium]